MIKFVIGRGPQAGQPLNPEQPPIPMGRGRWKKFVKWVNDNSGLLALLFYCLERGIILFGNTGGGFRTQPLDKAGLAKEELNKSKQAGL